MAVVVCPRCGAKNRVDEARAAAMQPVCGRCHAKLGVPSPGGAVDSGHPLEVTDDTFARDVLGEGDRPVLLDCWAPWCGPCRMLGPTIERLAAESEGRYLVAKLNTDENPRVASRFRIASIPTMLIFKNGQVVDQLVGVQPGPAIKARLERHV